MTVSAVFETTSVAETLSKHLGMFSNPKGSHLLERTRPMGEWLDLRAQLETWPYARTLERAPQAETVAISQNGRRVTGLNFGSQDYLGLTAHPAVREAAIAAIRDFGPHVASSPMLQGNTTIGRNLEKEVADVLQCEHVLLFPTGWAAGFGAITGLVRPSDSIVIDQLGHASLLQGSRAATDNVYLFRHNDPESLRNRLQKIRAKDKENGILVVSEGLFSMDSDWPDIQALQAVAREYEAVLMLDIAHDFGSQGPRGSSQIGVQQMLGEVDLVMGSFSKSLASNGGFVATNIRSVRQYLGIFGGSHMYSNGISPVQSAAALAALRIAKSEEGDQLRKRAMDNVLRLRAGLEVRGIRCLGEPSNVVPVMAGDDALAKWTGNLLELNGIMANLVEFPAVPRGEARFRFQVMPTHTDAHIDYAIETFVRCLEQAKDSI